MLKQSIGLAVICAVLFVVPLVAAAG